MKNLFILFLTTIVLSNLYAQKTRKNPIPFNYTFNTNDTYLIKLQDESTFIAKFIEKSEDIFIFQSKSFSKFEITNGQIKSVEIIDSENIKKGAYWFPNPHATRYLFSPSAFNLKAGEGYFQSIYAIANSVNYGISDHFTIGAGTELISLFSGTPILALTPKLGGYKLGDKWTAGAGTIFVVGSDGGAGIGYGILTRGSHNHNITLGAGWAYSTNGNLESKPVATISGMTRISRKIAFISENWLIPADPYYTVFSYGLRFFGEKMAVDLAFINSKDIAEYIPIGIPFVDFVIKF